jgi:hypothetical protein
MNKPITVVYEDLKQKLANLINDSGLPAFIVESILRDYLNEVRIIVERQYKIDKAQYEESLLKTDTIVNEESE